REKLEGRKFARRSKSFFDSVSLFRMFYMSAVMTVGTLFVFTYFKDINMVKAWTASLTTLAVYQWFNAWNCRSERKSIFSQNPFSNLWLVAATTIVVVLQILALELPFLQRVLHTTPLSAWEWAIII